MFLCASRPCLSSMVQESTLCLVLLPCISSSSAGLCLLLVFMHFRYCKWRSNRASNAVDLNSCYFSTTVRRSSSDQLRWAIRRTLRACTTPSVLTRCSSVTSLLHRHTTDFISQLRCGIPRSLFHIWKMSKHMFTTHQHLSTIRTTDRTIHWGLCIVAFETKNEPSCVEQFISIGGLSVVGLYCVRSCVAPNIVRICPCNCFFCFPLLRRIDEIVWENFG